MRIRAVVVVAAVLLAAAGAANAQTVPLPPGCQSIPTPGWCEQRVDARHTFGQMGPRSLAFDASNYPHIAYGGNQLYHAWRDGLDWHTEVVDPAWNVGHKTSIAIDRAGRLHIAYYDAGNKRLKYANRQTVGQWLVIPLVSSGFDAPPGWGGQTEPQIELAVDQFNNPHIVYTDFGQINGETWQRVNYLSASNGTGAAYWSPVTTIGKSKSIDDALSMSLDPGSPPLIHVSYRGCAGVTGDAYGCAIYHVYRSFDGQWYTEPAFGPADLPHNAIGIDGWHRPVILFDKLEDPADYNSLRLTYRDDNEWILPDFGNGFNGVFDAGRRFDGLSLAIDASTPPVSDYVRDAWYAAAQTRDESKRNMIVFSGPVYSSLIETNDDTGYWPSVAIPPSGYPGVSFFDMATSELHFEQMWSHGYASGAPDWGPLETVDISEDVGGFPSMQLDRQGRPWVVYYDKTRKDLLWRRMTSAGWTAAGQVDPTRAGHVRDGNGLALTSKGLPAVAYVTEAGELWYAYMLCGSTCSFYPMLVVPGGIPHYVGRQVALALDSHDQPYILYSDGGQLTIAVPQAGFWSHQVVHPGLGVYGWCQLRIDASGGLHAVYDDAFGDLFYARRKGATWVTSQVPLAAYGDERSYRWGDEFSLTVTPAGIPSIAYAVGSSIKLISLAKGQAGAGMYWMPPQTLYTHPGAPAEIAGLASAADASGRTSIAYYYTSSSAAGLHYLSSDRGKWQSRRIASPAHVGWRPALALDRAGHARVAYHDPQFGSLNLAWEGPFLKLK